VFVIAAVGGFVGLQIAQVNKLAGLHLAGSILQSAEDFQKFDMTGSLDVILIVEQLARVLLRLREGGAVEQQARKASPRNARRATGLACGTSHRLLFAFPGFAGFFAGFLAGAFFGALPGFAGAFFGFGVISAQ